jgi:hypothetical protein
MPYAGLATGRVKFPLSLSDRQVGVRRRHQTARFIGPQIESTDPVAGTSDNEGQGGETVATVPEPVSDLMTRSTITEPRKFMSTVPPQVAGTVLCGLWFFGCVICFAQTVLGLIRLGTGSDR